MNNIDPLELHKNIPSYQDRIREPQVDIKYGLFIYQKKIINLTTATKRRKAITKTEYKRLNRKSYKNLTWLNKMYDRRMKQMEMHEEEDKDNIYKVIMPLEFKTGYKLYNHNGDYYATVMGQDDIFCFLAVGKDTQEVHYFLKDFIERMYLQAQCDQKYGFTVPLKFIENYERPG